MNAAVCSAFLQLVGSRADALDSPSRSGIRADGHSAKVATCMAGSTNRLLEHHSALTETHFAHVSAPVAAPPPATASVDVDPAWCEGVKSAVLNVTALYALSR